LQLSIHFIEFDPLALNDEQNPGRPLTTAIGLNAIGVPLSCHSTSTLEDFIGAASEISDNYYGMLRGGVFDGWLLDNGEYRVVPNRDRYEIANRIGTYLSLHEMHNLTYDPENDYRIELECDGEPASTDQVKKLEEHVKSVLVGKPFHKMEREGNTLEVKVQLGMGLVHQMETPPFKGTMPLIFAKKPIDASIKAAATKAGAVVLEFGNPAINGQLEDNDQVADVMAWIEFYWKKD
jgi:hypothetical protein